ncbi:MAG: hypothetical protein [Caudoviricetes sp.]|nr:MAG: hypothetical protein [Caudoviricetes sp.]
MATDIFSKCIAFFLDKITSLVSVSYILINPSMFILDRFVSNDLLQSCFFNILLLSSFISKKSVIFILLFDPKLFILFSLCV